MNSYGDDIDAILDTLEIHFNISEERLEKNNLLDYVTNRNNLDDVRGFVIWARRKKESYKSPKNATNAVLRWLKRQPKNLD